MTHDEDPKLEDAYALETPEDSRRLYAGWAETYDQSFAETYGYRLPQVVAEHFVLASGEGPVLDVGAGTGLCGAHLRGLGVKDVDATDISQEMLDVAETKAIYRKLFVGDLTKRLPIEDAYYAGIVSSGTFTTGHVGPDAFDELLRIIQPGGLLAISINGSHFQTAGFEAKLAALQGHITDLQLPEERYYDDDATGDHRNDTGYIALFRKVRD